MSTGYHYRHAETIQRLTVGSNNSRDVYAHGHLLNGQYTLRYRKNVHSNDRLFDTSYTNESDLNRVIGAGCLSQRTYTAQDGFIRYLDLFHTDLSSLYAAANTLGTVSKPAIAKTSVDNHTSKRFCNYCDSEMEVIEDKASAPKNSSATNYDPNLIRHTSAEIKIGHHCDQCGWWCLEAQNYRAARGENARDNYRSLVGVLHVFDLSDKDAAMTELQEWISKNPSAVSELHLTAFEKLVASCFKNHFRNADVKHVGGSRDRGIDTIIIDNMEHPILVQIKRRKNLQATEGVRVVRELNGVLLRENSPRGMVVTSAKKFSKDAHSESTTIWEGDDLIQRFQVELIDYDQLLGMLSELPRVNTPPWYDLDIDSVEKYTQPRNRFKTDWSWFREAETWTERMENG